MIVKELTKEERIAKECRRLRSIYRDISKEMRTIYDGLVRRAAYMRVVLEDYEADLDQGGYTEMFTQSISTPPYERERPVARLYNAMNKNYQSIMKQLAAALPEGEKGAADPAEEIMKFAMGRKK